MRDLQTFVFAPISSCFALILLSSPAFAILGESVQTIPAGQKKLSTMQRNASKGTEFEVYEYSLSPAITIREYATLSGLVFGIAWSGTLSPSSIPFSGLILLIINQP